MFAGLMTLEYQGGSVLASESAGSLTRKRLHRRPGYMRPELPRPQSTSAGEEGSTTCLFNGASGSAGWDCNNDIMVEPTKPLSVIRQQPASDKLTLDQCRHVKTLLSSSPAPSCPREDCCTTRCPSRPQANLQPLCNLKLTPGSGLQPCLTGPGPSSFGDTFSSSFSFIQQSLTSIPGTHTVSDEPGSALEPPPLDQSSPKTLPPRPGFELCVQSPPESVYTCPQTSKTPGGRDLGQPAAVPGQSEPRSAPPSQSELTLGEKLWRERHWEGREETGCCASVTSDLRESLPDSDSCSLDTEAASSLSVDSDAASASSATSGYDSTTPVGDQGPNWDGLVKKYERVLQDCLQNNRTNTKIESMMLKLQRLQQKAILDDDYDTAERFGKKLEELRVERGSLKLGLPSRQPGVSLFLQRLRQAVHSALQRTGVNYRDGLEANKTEGADSVQSPQGRRERLLQDKRLVEAEMQELQRQLEELQERRLCLEQQIQLEVQHQETEEVEGMALRSCTMVQLRDMSRTLEDLVTCQNRTQMCVSPPASTLSLQEQERALSVSIKEATAKVVMSQRLGASLRRKVSETETQLLALHEAKLAAISGNDFSSAKELKAEMRTVYVERDRLEGLAKRLHSLSAGNSQELARMKDQQHQLKQELEQSEALHERSLKENALKYIELLEDKLHSCGCSALECVWEADLEACHLFLRGIQLRTPSYSGPDVEDLPAPVVHPTQQCTKEEEDCAMLTALGGRWCPEANLQNSEFTKKLEEFLFSMEDNHTEDECSEAVDLTEQCELISDRLMTLEDNLQTAILNRDKGLTQSLETEVREVKATLQTMLAQLKEEEDEEGEEEGEDGAQGEEEEEKKADDIMENENEDEEEDEDQYFSDSWEI